jgi:hypothetical protein
MADDILTEIREQHTAAKDGIQDIHKEGATNMKFVGGNPWNADDDKIRKDRPTVAPEEMGQYFNQVINQLRMNPRAMRFVPNGNGASEAGATFYQNKARETEYRSKAQIAYIMAAENAIQRGYGYVKLDVRYASARDANQEMWIDPVPDPDMILPDPAWQMPDLSDMTFCFERQWQEQDAHEKRYGTRLTGLSELAGLYPAWFQGNKVLTAVYWTVSTKKRQLVQVQGAQPTQPQRLIAPPPQAAASVIVKFADEVQPGETIVRDLRTVDYPKVMKYLTNGVELLADPVEWPGKYIPIVGCFGKILYIPEGGVVTRKILAMTNFGREIWKAYCYVFSQQLEVIGRGMKASVMAPEGQLAGHEQDWEEASYRPKLVLYYKAILDAAGQNPLPPPTLLPFAGAEEVSALELVKESCRRAIQAAMGSNFLPTQAQKRNEKSGVALDKINQSAATGTFHFVDHYDGMIRQVAHIFEDVCDKVHDYQGTTGVVKPDETSDLVVINDPSRPNAISTKGDYLVTVSTGPSSDSAQDAQNEFISGSLLPNLEMVVGVAGKQAGAGVLARSIKAAMPGPKGDELAELVDPTLAQKQGQPTPPLPPQVQQQLQQGHEAMQAAHQLMQEKQAETVKYQAQMQIESMKQDKQTQRELLLLKMKLAADIEKTRITAAKQSADLDAEAQEERLALGIDAVHQDADRQHEAALQADAQAHEAAMAQVGHQQALEAGAQSHEQALAQGAQQAALQPPESGMGASA